MGFSIEGVPNSGAPDDEARGTVQVVLPLKSKAISIPQAALKRRRRRQTPVRRRLTIGLKNVVPFGGAPTFKMRLLRCPGPVPPEYAENFVGNLVGYKRLGHEITGAEAESLFGNRIASAKYDYGKVVEALFVFRSPQLLKDGETVDSRHENVENHQIGPVAVVKHLQGFFPAFCCEHFKAVGTEAEFDEPQDTWFVVHNEHGSVFAVL